jgi:hypothetical protein
MHYYTLIPKDCKFSLFAYFHLKDVCKRLLTRDNRTANSNAHQKPSTPKPGTSQPTNIIKNPFMNRIKRPRVRMVTGKVKRMNKGLTKALMMDRTADAKSALKKFSILMPGNMLATRNIVKPLTIIFANSSI